MKKMIMIAMALTVSANSVVFANTSRVETIQQETSAQRQEAKAKLQQDLATAQADIKALRKELRKEQYSVASNGTAAVGATVAAIIEASLSSIVTNFVGGVNPAYRTITGVAAVGIFGLLAFVAYTKGQAAVLSYQQVQELKALLAEADGEIEQIKAKLAETEG